MTNHCACGYRLPGIKIFVRDAGRCCHPVLAVVICPMCSAEFEAEIEGVKATHFYRRGHG